MMKLKKRVHDKKNIKQLFIKEFEFIFFDIIHISVKKYFFWDC